VKLVRVARVRSADTLVNAVLRRATREPNFDPVSDIEDALDRIAVQTSHPRWLIERWADAFGIVEATAFAQANNQTPTTSFRVIKTRASEAEIIQKIRDEGVTVAPSPISPNAWRAAESFVIIQRLAREGLIYLQDEASQLVSHLLEAQPGESILDACAAPGSKSTHLADLTNGQTLIVSGDLHLHRLQTLNRLAAAQRLTSIHSVKLDATGALPFREGAFDRVLVDAPCSGTGTLQHNPEIRWRISPRDLVDLPARQLAILANAARSVKPGGRLIYSTCSIELDENEQVVRRFLAQTSEFMPIRLPVNPALYSDSRMVRIWPHKHGVDGFFVAGFERQS
jgi:16S rRNA (cytosine967-C5)-methyltransferase